MGAKESANHRRAISHNIRPQAPPVPFPEPSESASPINCRCLPLTSCNLPRRSVVLVKPDSRNERRRPVQTQARPEESSKHAGILSGVQIYYQSQIYENEVAIPHPDELHIAKNSVRPPAQSANKLKVGKVVGAESSLGDTTASSRTYMNNSSMQTAVRMSGERLRGAKPQYGQVACRPTCRQIVVTEIQDKEDDSPAEVTPHTSISPAGALSPGDIIPKRAPNPSSPDREIRIPIRPTRHIMPAEANFTRRDDAPRNVVPSQAKREASPDDLQPLGMKGYYYCENTAPAREEHSGSSSRTARQDPMHNSANSISGISGLESGNMTVMSAATVAHDSRKQIRRVKLKRKTSTATGLPKLHAEVPMRPPSSSAATSRGNSVRHGEKEPSGGSSSGRSKIADPDVSESRRHARNLVDSYAEKKRVWTGEKGKFSKQRLSAWYAGMKDQ